MKNTIFSILCTSLFFLNCNGQQKSDASEFDLIGTKWEYSDKDWTYQIEFLENGKIKSTHPNETTPDNDKWSQIDNQVEMKYNNGYVKYKGEFKSKDIIEGTATNGKGEWEWKMERIE